MKARIVQTGTLAVIALLASCSTRAPSTSAPVPTSSPLAQIHEGMGMTGVTQLAGPPTDTCSHITGKAFIPFYFGNDKYVTELHYRGQGRVILSGGMGSPQVSAVEYDPNESGYCQ
jgi:hypothetical protein